MYKVSCLSKDFLAAHLRFQLDALKSILSNIESSEDRALEDSYVIESLQRVEVNLRGLRKFLSS